MDTRTPSNAARRSRKRRQHAASLATGALVFVIAIGAMQAVKSCAPAQPPVAAAAAGSTAGPVVSGSGGGISSSGTASSGSSAVEATAAGGEESGPAGMPASPAARQIMGMPAVYIHVLNDQAREQALRLAPALREKGIALAGVKVVASGPRSSDLRYFRPSEKEEAAKVQAALLSLGLPARQLKGIGGYETSAVPRQYELWLVSDFKG